MAKTFRYYADKAEAALEEAAFWDDPMLNDRTHARLLHAADVYTRLAAAATAPEPPEPPAQFVPDVPESACGVDNRAGDARCMALAGHAGDHLYMREIGN